MPNRFFTWTFEQSTPTPFVPQQLLDQLSASDYRYFVRIMCELDRIMPDAGFTFVITWRIDAWDDVLNGAVVILVGDERYQIPSYARRARAVFKTGGINPNPIGQTLRLPPSIAWRVFLRDARNMLIRCKRIFRCRGGDMTAPIYALPLGPFALENIELRPIYQRPVDVFFAGTLSASGWSVRPSVTSRKQMAKALAKAQAAMPHYRFESIVQLSRSKCLSPTEYTRAIANTKIALAPRGNFDETFRLFEAAKLGCVIISELLPPRWYYKNCPVVTLRAWSQLQDVLRELLQDKPRLAELSRQTRQWWESVLSEQMIAMYIAEQLHSQNTTNR